MLAIPADFILARQGSLGRSLLRILCRTPAAEAYASSTPFGCGRRPHTLTSYTAGPSEAAGECRDYSAQSTTRQSSTYRRKRSPRTHANRVQLLARVFVFQLGGDPRSLWYSIGGTRRRNHTHIYICVHLGVYCTRYAARLKVARPRQASRHTAIDTPPPQCTRRQRRRHRCKQQ